MRIIRSLLLALIAVAASWGMFARPSNAPVERLASNVADYVKKHPQDAKGYYTLGRIYYLAYALHAKSLDYHQGADLIVPFSGFSPGRVVQRGEIHEALQEKQRSFYLGEALRLLKQSVALDPGNGLYELGLACVYEDGKTAAGGAEWRELAINRYLAAYRLSIGPDKKLPHQPLFGIQTLVSYEAGSSYVRLIKQRGTKPSEAATTQQIEKDVATLESLPRGPITPIVFSFRSGATLGDLLSPELRVSFDLDGTGRRQSYEWLQPDAALLVWDPEHTGQVTSGRQLFGTVTWWMFWENGYQALAALDDNHDGWLTGAELSGLALWFDRNQNGISEPGEVIPIEDAGVEALAASADHWDGRSLMSSRGVRLKDGRVLPSWDWVATGLQDEVLATYRFQNGRATCARIPDRSWRPK